MTRHDGKPDLREPYKTVAWSLGALAAVARGTAQAFERLGQALRNDDDRDDDIEAVVHALYEMWSQ